ncbi:MAG: carboxynorspermidine decarboxylase, partial [Clostridiales bacterium]
MMRNSLPSPCYLIDLPKLTANLRLLSQVMQETGCKILLAQKAFAAYALYPLIGEYLSGAAASGLYEA